MIFMGGFDRASKSWFAQRLRTHGNHPGLYNPAVITTGPNVFQILTRVSLILLSDSSDFQRFKTLT